MLAAGLTPAFQHIFVFDTLRLGEVNRAREVHSLASGKALNAGIALHHLGGASRTLSLSGGLPGEIMEQELRALGMSCRWIRTGRATRNCTTLVELGSGACTELVENAAPLGPEELDAFLQAFEEEAGRASFIVLSGSLPAGTPKTLYRDLLQKSSVPVILDASGPELREALSMRPFCIKPNRQELARTAGVEIRSEGDLFRAVAEMHRRGAQWVLVSDGVRALLASDGRAAWRFFPPRVQTVNPIGSGDCLAAGVAWASRGGADMLEAVRFGVAAAAENAAALLPARLVPERVRERMAEVRIEEAEAGR